jgi:2-phospho-L-lactate guanylyltransferase
MSMPDQTPGQISGQTRTDTIALVPLNALDVVKSRLRHSLDDGNRRALVLWLAKRVLAALSDSGVVDRIGIVSPDSLALAPFAPWGPYAPRKQVTPLYTEGGELNEDLKQGRRWALEEGAHQVLVVLADLPFLSAVEVCEMVRRARASQARPYVLLAPDRAERGTNALLLRPADALPFAFGVDSLSRHTALARERGIEPDVYRSAATSFDVDTPADVRELIAQGAWRPAAWPSTYPQGVSHDG